MTAGEVTPAVVRDVCSKTKGELAAYVREHGFVWASSPPERWTKDELVTEVLWLMRNGS